MGIRAGKARIGGLGDKPAGMNPTQEKMGCDWVRGWANCGDFMI